MTTGVTWVAIAGLVLSIASLVWQAVVTFVRLPRLEIGLSSVATAPNAKIGLKAGVVFTVTVHNRGAEPVEVYDLGLETETGVRFAVRDSPRMRRTAPNLSKEVNLGTFYTQVNGPDMPATIPARSTVSWKILNAATVDHGPQVPWRAWAERYRASGRPRHTASKTSLRRGI